MSQKVLLDVDDAQALITCLQTCKNIHSVRLRLLIEEKMRSTPLMDRIRQEGIENYYEEGEVEIDDGAVVSIAEGDPEGAYVMGWIWVTVPEAPKNEEPEATSPV